MALTKKEKEELAQARAKRRGLAAVETPEGFEEVTLEQAELTPSVPEQKRLAKEKQIKEETARKLQEGAEKPLEGKPLEEESFFGDVGERTSAELAEMQRRGESPLTPEQEERRKKLGISAAAIGAAAGGGIAAAAGRVSISAARASLTKLGKWEGIKIFGKYTFGLKEMVAGTAIFSQTVVRKLIKNLDADATKLGTERNEKIARWMISGLDPDKAIELYEQDKEYLIDAKQSIQLYRIFYFWDYVAGDVGTTKLNIQNQIDAKDSRIAEALKFKAGITTADIQRMIMETEGGEENAEINN